jgi:hypothetical protein
MHAVIGELSVIYPPTSLHVVLDGRVIGYVEENSVAEDLVESLRYY